MSGTTRARDESASASTDDLARRLETVQFDRNPLTPIKAEALLELYDRQHKANDPQAVFTLGMIEGFIESQQPDFDLDTATERISQRIGDILLKRMFGPGLRTEGGSDETDTSSLQEKITALSQTDPEMARKAGEVAGLNWGSGIVDDPVKAQKIGLAEITNIISFMSGRVRSGNDMGS
jgi:hypothetical protein